VSVSLTTTDLYKAFGQNRPAIDNVSFTVEPGEIVVLLGPSGCGKTTTLRSVAGLETPTSGVIAIGNEVVSDPMRGVFVKPQKREVGMVFQSYAIWPHMTVRENVAYPLRHRRLGRAEMDKRVAEALEIVNLQAYIDRPATALSGGQMQRVALARSLVYHPRLLLLDEPLSNLDAKLRLRLRDDLRRIIKAAGVTALYVTHDQSEAVAVGDRVGVMRDGKMLQLSPPTELYNNPADLFVAEFTGATNVFSGHADESDRDGTLVALDHGITVRAKASRRFGKGEPIKLAVRPENIRIANGGGEARLPGAWNYLSGQIQALRYQGMQTTYDIVTSSFAWEAVEFGTTPRYGEDQEVTMCLPVDGCWAFPADEQVSTNH
jgi:iron(III) transport system ATP-binding protein